MSFFSIIAFDPEPHNMEARNKLRDEHRKFVLEHDQMIRFATAMVDDAGNQKGSLYILETENEEHVQAWIDQEPFFKGGVYQRIHVEKILPALNRMAPKEWR